MLVLCEHITPRLSYVLDYVLTERLGISYRLYEQKKYTEEVREPVIYYLNHSPETEHGIWIPCSGFLYSKPWHRFVPEVAVTDRFPVVFPHRDNSAISFDLLAAVFWFLTRYEEYDNESADEHGRFPASASLSVQSGFNDQPVVDLWIIKLQELLENKFPSVDTHLPQPFFRLTIDIDQAFAVRHKGWLRSGAGLIRSLVEKNSLSFKEYSSILTGKTNDPYGRLLQMIPPELEKGMVASFFHTGRWGRYDKSIPTQKTGMQTLIREAGQVSMIGLHPSYRILEKPDELEYEKTQLERVTGKPVIRSRYHYLRFRLPESYRILLENGITEDYSMGWPETTGFRAGTAHPFPWYDLNEDQATPLTIYPFPVMDGVLKDRIELLPDQAVEWMVRMIQTLYGYKAPFIPLWHNHSLSGIAGWEGWSPVYESFLQQAMDIYLL